MKKFTNHTNYIKRGEAMSRRFFLILRINICRTTEDSIWVEGFLFGVKFINALFRTK